MKYRFQITRKNRNDFIIKQKRYFIYLFQYSRVMNKAEFLPDLNEYGQSVLSEEWATFKSVNESFSALAQWANINGVEEVIVKVVDRL